MPKAFVPLLGRPLLWHCVQSLLAAACIEIVVVAVGEQHQDLARAAVAEAGGKVRIVIGGTYRCDSVRAALRPCPTPKSCWCMTLLAVSPRSA